jgi:anti-anti-sigma factor
VSPFAVRTVCTPACARVIIIGELDLAGVSTVMGCIDAVVATQPRPGRVVLDLRELRFADLVGARALRHAYDRLACLGPVEVRGIQPAVQRVLDMAQLTLPSATRQPVGLPSDNGP